MDERILDKIDQLDRYLKELEEDMPQNLSDYRDERRKYERLLHLLIETVVDISAIIVKRESLGTPSDEESIIDKLIESEIVDNSFGNKLKNMKGFRNVLVHRYGEIDDEKVYEKLDELQDFRDFRKKVIQYIENTE